MIKESPGRCTYCLGYFDHLTDDHLPPKSWYPKSISDNFPKPRVPACRACNAQYGQIEDDFLSRMGRCLDPADPGAYGLSQKALRSIDPAYGKNPRDQQLRKARRSKLQSQTVSTSAMPRSAFLPDLRPADFSDDLESLALGIPANSIQAICEKFVRGFTLLSQQLYIESSHFIQVYLWRGQQISEVSRIIERFGKEIARGPGFRVSKAAVSDDPVSGVVEIVLWDRLPFYATVRPISSARSVRNSSSDEHVVASGSVGCDTSFRE